MFNRSEIRSRIQSLASKNVFIGTSSWKYPGWCGMIYDEGRYLTRGKFTIGYGRDAADVALTSYYGALELTAMKVTVEKAP